MISGDLLKPQVFQSFNSHFSILTYELTLAVEY